METSYSSPSCSEPVVIFSNPATSARVLLSLATAGCPVAGAWVVSATSKNSSALSPSPLASRSSTLARSAQSPAAWKSSTVVYNPRVP